VSELFDRLHDALSRLYELAAGRLAPGTEERILAERRRRLAARGAAAAARERLSDVVAVRRGGQALGLPLGAVREIWRVRAVPLPYATAFVQGLFAVGGRTECLVDPLPFFADPEPLPEDGSLLAAVVAHGRRSVGLRVDEVLGVRTVWADERSEGLSRSGLVSAVTRDLLAVVDVAALLARPELVLAAAPRP